jgi:cytosine/adenosine deaminase-related metal-dependent hydrolase
MPVGVPSSLFPLPSSLFPLVLLLRARYVVPVTDPPIEDGVVGVDGDRIGFVGPASDVPDGPVRDLGDVILLPGLVNAHTHLELTAMRGFLEDLDFRRWILRLTSAKRSVLTPDMLMDSARLGIVEGILAGITTYADTCDSGVAFDAMQELGVRGIMYQEVFGPDPVVAAASLSDLRAKVDAMRRRETPLVRVGISPHAPYTVSDDLFAVTARYARDAGLPLAVHVAESEIETRLIVEGAGAFADGLRARGIVVEPRGSSPVSLLSRLGVLGARPLLIHCVRVDAADIATIAAARCPVVHCPISNAKLGHGIAPLIEMLDSGVEVALGSDSVASNNRMDILEEARGALLMQRARLGTHEGLTAHDVLELATIGGACALGLGDAIGSLEIGKAADLAAFPLTTRGPVHDPESTAVFALSGERATFVMVAGYPLVEGGQFNRSIDGLGARVQSAADALREWLGSGGELVPPPRMTIH